MSKHKRDKEYFEAILANVRFAAANRSYLQSNSEVQSDVIGVLSTEFAAEFSDTILKIGVEAAAILELRPKLSEFLQKVLARKATGKLDEIYAKISEALQQPATPAGQLGAESKNIAVIEPARVTSKREPVTVQANASLVARYQAAINVLPYICAGAEPLTDAWRRETLALLSFDFNPAEEWRAMQLGQLAAQIPALQLDLCRLLGNNAPELLSFNCASGHDRYYRVYNEMINIMPESENLSGTTLFRSMIRHFHWGRIRAGQKMLNENLAGNLDFQACYKGYLRQLVEAVQSFVNGNSAAIYFKSETCFQYVGTGNMAAIYFMLEPCAHYPALAACMKDDQFGALWNWAASHTGEGREYALHHVLIAIAARHERFARQISKISLQQVRDESEKLAIRYIDPNNLGMLLARNGR